MDDGYLQFRAWFRDYFPDSYVVAMSETMSILREWKISRDISEKGLLDLYKTLHVLNGNHAGIFFTPNKIKDAKKRHALDNFGGYNAWYIDIDIPGGEGKGSTEVYRQRDVQKRRILEHVSGSENGPSLVSESRNGYHLFWLRAGSGAGGEGSITDSFCEIERGIAEHYREFGADFSTTKPITLLRIPCYNNYKHGETFRISLRPGMGRNGEDGNPRRYTPGEMLRAYPASEIPPIKVRIPKVYRKQKKNSESEDIFEQIHQIPVEDALMRLSGHAIVGGETFELKKVGRNHYNIFIDGRATGNFIDGNRNRIFGPKGSTGNGPTLSQWLSYYANSWRDIVKVYKELFLNH